MVSSAHRAVLCIETSMTRGSIALCEPTGALLGERTWARGFSHGEKITWMIRDLLSEMNRSVEDLRGFAVNVGPGSFTGLRIGLAAARALAFGQDIPIWTCNTFELIAARCRLDPSLSRRSVAIAINAHGDSVFVARILSDGHLTPPRRLKFSQVTPTSELWNTPEDVLLTDLTETADLFSGEIRPIEPQYSPHAASIPNALSFSDPPKVWKDIHALYLKDSEAEERR